MNNGMDRIKPVKATSRFLDTMNCCLRNLIPRRNHKPFRFRIDISKSDDPGEWKRLGLTVKKIWTSHNICLIDSQFAYNYAYAFCKACAEEALLHITYAIKYYYSHLLCVCQRFERTENPNPQPQLRFLTLSPWKDA